MNKILAIDPSIISMGWAIMGYPPQSPRPVLLLDSGTIKAPDAMKSKPLTERIKWLLDKLESVILRFPNVAAAVIEQPESWGAYKSIASTHSGSLLSLHIMVGALVGWSLGKDLQPVLIKVSKWKGQLTKRITKMRMEEKHSTTFVTDDEADAVGIGDYFLMKENQE